jgi:RNA polymerase sigma-70 factor (ECF subfamily)
LADFRRQDSRRSAIEERDLIQKILSGERDLYARLVERHQRNLYQLCLAILSDPHEAEEAAQVAFIKAYRALGSFHGDSSFRTWLTRIGLNHCRDLLRTRKKRRFLSLEILLAEGRKVPDALIERLPEPPEPLPVLTPEMLGSLSEGERKIVELVRDREGCISYEEIGKELGLSLDGVKGRLKRARAKLHQWVEKSARNS